ncbi:MAG: nitrate reductase molybdenum cofactor assembly chaperone [Thermoanaerobaculia bacterium]
MSVVARIDRTAMGEVFAAFADLFRYPDVSFFDRLDHARRVLRDDDAEAFVREISSLDRPQLEATYTSTFDLAPSCSPYLGVYLFGDDGRERGRLLVGLRMSYEKAGIALDERELPDHIAEVLAFAAHDDAEEWSDLVRLILVPALTKMEERVRSSANPYRHLIAAARHASEAALSRGGEW